MRTLQDRLDAIRASFAEKAPADAKAVMERATNDLRDSGIMDRLPKVGDQLPPFELADTNGDIVRSEELLAAGPLVVTVYRGEW